MSLGEHRPLKVGERRRTLKRTSQKVICYHCGESGHLAKDCDLQEDACYNCSRGGYIARIARSPRAILLQLWQTSHLARGCR
ncbi:zinc finger CCHC-type containing 13 [Rhinolophus ferrumequinum]|uniref:Zinc finger CCHC-type containing 13 n=1 Tax=Rhinolophus ferrumequinum TaxID=59479 RepID=A0A7J7X8M1_RHIFE|nr:zinc finger CCHC-type containing 13 [Rhinolophus ferrumequinum]